MEPAEAAALLKEERAGLGAGALPGDDLARGQPLDRPDLPRDESLHLGNQEGLVQQQVPKPVADKPMLFDEDNKVAIKADEFGEQRRQLGGERSCFFTCVIVTVSQSYQLCIKMILNYYFFYILLFSVPQFSTFNSGQTTWLIVLS